MAPHDQCAAKKNEAEMAGFSSLCALWVDAGLDSGKPKPKRVTT
jgi:hypothetical protein